MSAALFLGLNAGAKARLWQAGSDPLKSICEIACSFWRGPSEKNHGDGLLEMAFDIPTGVVTIVREDGVDTSNGLFGLLLVELVVGSAVLLLDGERSRCSDGFERVAGLRMARAETHGNSVAEENKRGKDGDGGQETLYK